MKSLIIYFSRADENYAVGYIDNSTCSYPFLQVNALLAYVLVYWCRDELLQFRHVPLLVFDFVYSVYQRLIYML